MSKRIALYLMGSTAEQTVENQQRELESVAEWHGWNVVAVFTDAGISGTTGREKRPGYDHLCRDITRREFEYLRRSPIPGGYARRSFHLRDDGQAAYPGSSPAQVSI
jgi:hypothetical protein